MRVKSASKQVVTKYRKCPPAKGKLCIYPAISYGKILSIKIIGDRKGLKYLAALAEYLAELDLEKMDIPTGGSAHLHLKPEVHIGWNSSDVVVCRAEAPKARI
jgi:hypothetical protein